MPKITQKLLGALTAVAFIGSIPAMASTDLASDTRYVAFGTHEDGTITKLVLPERLAKQLIVQHELAFVFESSPARIETPIKIRRQAAQLGIDVNMLEKHFSGLQVTVIQPKDIDPTRVSRVLDVSERDGGQSYDVTIYGDTSDLETMTDVSGTPIEKLGYMASADGQFMELTEMSIAPMMLDMTPVADAA